MTNTRPRDDRPGANRLADYPPMGEPTAKPGTGQTTSPERPVRPVPQDGRAGTPQARSRSPRAVLVGVRDGFRVPGRPRLWIEILLIGAAYWVYSLIRNAVPEQESSAMRHADQLWRLEQALGIAVERAVNHGVDSVTWLIVGMNYYYATLHFIVTIGVLVWLFRYHPGRYSPARMVLFATTGVALLGYYFYPLAPPRLMRGMDFIDTVVVHHTWGSMASGDLANVSNQYAAMPSMHIGWSLWCGITIAVLAKRTWVRVLGLVYPAVTLVVIVATANHFWLDAVGGATCLAVGFGVSRAAHGRWPYAFPKQPLAEIRAAQEETASAAGDGSAAPGGPGPVAPVPAPARSRDHGAGPGREPAGKPGTGSAPGTGPDSDSDEDERVTVASR